MDNSDIYSIIDELCVEQEKRRNKIDVEKLLNHLNENLANPKSMKGTDKIFKNIVDNKYVILFSLFIIFKGGNYA